MGRPGGVDRDLIAAAVRSAPHRFGLSGSVPPATVAVRRLGSGESYTAWLVRPAGAVDGTDGAAGREPIVVRVARRPVPQMPRPMAEEFRALGEIPAGIGPRPVRLEQRSDLLGAPFMVTGLVPGRPLDPSGWTPDLVQAHARQLALLHARPYRTGGRIGRPAERRDTVDPLDRLDRILAWWRSAHPQVLADPDVAALIPRVRERIAATALHFQRLRRLAVVHGDLVLANILVDDHRVPRYVDWEWVEIGDPAQDLAYLGGPIEGPSWYLPMDDTQVDLLLRTYLEARGTDEDDLDSLRARRDAWQVFGRFVTSLHFRRLLTTPQDQPFGHATRTVNALTHGLLHFLT